MTVTIKDIARECGVGISTVSRVLNNHSDVSEKTKEKVLWTMKKYNYIPNNSARNLRLNTSRTIALLISTSAKPYNLEIIRILNKEIQNHGYTSYLHQLDPHDDEVEIAMELIKEKNLQGIIFIGGTFHDKETQLSKLKVPYVISSLGTDITSLNHHRCVSINDFGECSRAVSYLCSLGHQNIAIILPEKKNFRTQRCLDGYKEALIKSNRTFDDSLVAFFPGPNTFSFEYGFLCAQKLLDTGKNFTALFSISDVSAIGACRALIAAGKRIPEDISVMGYDNIELSAYYNPPLTTLSHPVKEIAIETASMLFDLIKYSVHSNRQTVFPCEIIERSSCTVL